MKNQTWDLVPLPLGRKLVQCKWIYRTNIVADGLVSKCKAEVIQKGFSKVQVIDYNETFALVSKMDSIQIVLTIVAAQPWEVHHRM